MSDEPDPDLAELEQPLVATPAVKPRPHDCEAARGGGRMACDRCGLSWPDIADGPDCRPITFAQIADYALSLVARAEASLATVRGVARRGMPTDGGAQAELDLAICKKLSRLADKIAADPQLRRALNKGAK